MEKPPASQSLWCGGFFARTGQMFHAFMNLQHYVHAVIVATGAEPVKPASIPGVKYPKVLMVNEALSGDVEITGKKVAVIGSGAAGLETADYLCKKGNQVTIVEMLDAIGKGVYV